MIAKRSGLGETALGASEGTLSPLMTYPLSSVAMIALYTPKGDGKPPMAMVSSAPPC
ncbi:MAG: hypothetical protein ACFFBV_16550 [Promethearchaeota archaeon]